MRVEADVIFGGARYNDPSGDFTHGSWFCGFMDEEGNSFDNVYARGDVFREDTKPEIGSRVRLALNVKKKRDGAGISLQIEGVIPADVAQRRRDALEAANTAKGR